jgi:CRISPR-associated exonuclease Cas4
LFTEDELLPVSALQHLVFCERQCALIYIEQVWAENAQTVEGHDLHERVDEGAGETRANLRVARGVPLRSFRLGLAGKADVVELRRVGDGESDQGVILPDVAGRWALFPVEYKRGKPKRSSCDRVQLCAQALCLEEMLSVEIPRGALFYGKTRRRLDVMFDTALRRETERAADRLRHLIGSGITPLARREPKCRECSLLQICMPDASKSSARSYIEATLRSP